MLTGAWVEPVCTLTAEQQRWRGAQRVWCALAAPARVKLLVASVMQPAAEYLLGGRALKVNEAQDKPRGGNSGGGGGRDRW